MIARRPARAALLAAGAGLTCALLGGCGVLLPAPSPKSTLTGPSGRSVVVDWKDYPASAGVDGEVLVGKPDQTALEAPTRALMAELRHVIEAASGVPLAAHDPEADWFGRGDWFPQDGNGYGGESMLVTVNCCQLSARRAPAPTRWRAVVEAASRVTAEAGLGRLALEQDSRDAESRQEYRKRYCNLSGGACWSWSASVYDGYRWVDVSIQDGRLDPSGSAARDAADHDLPIAWIEVGYGATVVQAGRSREYERALAPFEGLAQPPATTSD